MTAQFDYKEAIETKINQYIGSLRGIYFAGPFSKQGEELIEKNNNLIQKKEKCATDILAAINLTKNEHEALSLVKLTLSQKQLTEPEKGDHDLLRCLTSCKKILEISIANENDAQLVNRVK